MSMPTPEEFEAAGLYDPNDSTVVGRLDLLHWLVDEGFTIPEIQVSFESGALGVMVGDRWLVPDERLTRSVAIERTGLDPDLFDACSHALGLSSIQGSPEGEVGYTDGIIELLGIVAVLEDMFTSAEVLALIRVIGSAMQRIAEASVSTFLTDVESDLVRAGRSELEMGQAASRAVTVLEGMGERLDPLLRRHVLQAIERTRATMIDGVDRFQYRYAVGFVDLVGFTPLAGGLSAEELSDFIGQFEGRSHDVVAKAGARVVKLIGDEVMFVATDPSAACRAGRALIDQFARDVDGVLPRGGLAYGNVVLRGGDYYGAVVNLASRLADAAVPGELLVSDDLARSGADCDFEPAGRRMVKGFDEPVFVHSMMAN